MFLFVRSEGVLWLSIAVLVVLSVWKLPRSPAIQDNDLQSSRGRRLAADESQVFDVTYASQTSFSITRYVNA